MKKLVLLLIVLSSAGLVQAGGLVIRFGAKPTLRATHRTVVVTPTPTVRVVRPAITGCVDINTNRKHAKVYVNGNYVGNAGSLDGSPGKLELRPGTYTIRVQHEGVAFRERVRVTAGKEVNFNVRF